MFTRDLINKEMSRIMASRPELLVQKVVTKKSLTPTMKMVFEKALEDPNISEEKKQQVRNLLESGQLDKEVTTEDRKIAKMLDDYVIREMKKSVKAGRLPNKKQLKELQEIWKEQDKNTSKN